MLDTVTRPFSPFLNIFFFFETKQHKKEREEKNNHRYIIWKIHLREGVQIEWEVFCGSRVTTKKWNERILSVSSWLRGWSPANFTLLGRYRSQVSLTILHGGLLEDVTCVPKSATEAEEASSQSVKPSHGIRSVRQRSYYIVYNNFRQPDDITLKSARTHLWLRSNCFVWNGHLYRVYTGKPKS